MSIEMHHYKAYGLHVGSELAVPFAPAPLPAPEPDVSIRIGALPEGTGLPESGRQQPWTAAPDAFVLNVDGVARYLVREGRDIVIEPAGGSDQAIRAFLLGSVLAACLQQRDILTLHASAVETSAGAVLFAGGSGDGKSTLLAALVKRGYAMLSDDVAGIVLDAGERPVALPAFPCVRLWAQALDELDWPGLERVREELEKYVVPVERFRDASLPVRAVCGLDFHAWDRIEIEAQPPAAAFELLVRCTYRHRHLLGLGRQPAHFRTVAAMARQVPVHLVKRPAYPFSLDALTDRIEGLLHETPPAESDGHPAATAVPASRGDGTATSP